MSVNLDQVFLKNLKEWLCKDKEKILKIETISLIICTKMQEEGKNVKIKFTVIVSTLSVLSSLTLTKLDFITR